MTLYTATAEVEQVLREGPIERSEIVDVFLDDASVLRYSNMFHALSVDDGTGAAAYTPMGDRIVAPEQIRESNSLGSNNIEVFLDSSRMNDPSDPVNALINNDVIQRRARLRTILFRPGTNRTVPIWLFNVREAVVNGLDDSRTVNNMPALKVRLASGVFAYNERRNLTYSSADQKDLYPGDTGFDKVARLIDIKLNWRS